MLKVISFLLLCRVAARNLSDLTDIQQKPQKLLPIV